MNSNWERGKIESFQVYDKRENEVITIEKKIDSRLASFEIHKFYDGMCACARFVLFFSFCFRTKKKETLKVNSDEVTTTTTTTLRTEFIAKKGKSFSYCSRLWWKTVSYFYVVKKL